MTPPRIAAGPAARPLRPLLQRALLVCVVLDLLLWGLLASPWSPSRARAEAHLAAVTTRSAMLHSQVAALRRVQQHLLASRAQAQQLLAGMPPARSADFQVLQALQDIAQHAGVRAGSISFAPGRQAELGLLPVTVQVEVSGDYVSLVRFINDVERSPLFLVVDQVALGSHRGAKTSALALAVQLETYEQVPPEPAAKGKEPAA